VWCGDLRLRTWSLLGWGHRCYSLSSSGAELDLGSDLAVDLAPPGYKGDSYKADIVSFLCAGMYASYGILMGGNLVDC